MDALTEAKWQTTVNIALFNDVVKVHHSDSDTIFI